MKQDGQNKLMMVSQEDIEKDLRKLGVAKGDMLEVHSSLSSIGHVVGGAATVVDALMRVVGTTGALVMSNYPITPPLPITEEERANGIAWKIRRLPDDSVERTGTGAISDDFRHRSDVICGSGIHRVCAWGQDAEIHSTGYEYLAENGGLVLLIGVDIDRCSSMHLSEKIEVTESARNRMNALWGPSQSPPIPNKIKQQYPPEIILGSEETGRKGDPWTNARDEAYRCGLIKKGRIGNAHSMLFKAKDVLSLLEEVRQNGPFQS